MSGLAGLRLYLATAFSARWAEEGVPVATVLLAVHRTGSAAQGAYILTAWTAPHLIASPLAGALVARSRNSRLSYASALAGVGAAILGVCLLLGRVPLALVFALALAGGAFGPIVTGGLSSLVAGLAPQGPQRARAYALDAAVYNAASALGPAAVTAITVASSSAVATGALAGGALVATVLVALTPPSAGTWRPAQHEQPAARRWHADLRRGMRALWRTPVLRVVTAGSCLAYLGTGALSTTAVLLAVSRGYAGGGGTLISVFACTALAGSLAVARWQPPLSAVTIAWLGLLTTGAALAAAAAVRPFAACATLFAIAGLGDGPLLSAILRIRADYAPDDARAQVFTLAAGLKIFAGSCGTAIVGAVSHAPPSALLLGIAALQCIAAAALARSQRSHVPASVGRPVLHADR
ncbi:MAG TPA: MFS transporter [Actinocrinis sp.]|uniref:MFS transporter n=1 Tax=Actinocrinis sp. TaxID=1920516 RepID=UPI002D24602B|nr:MFS transporter [Actinocrinis sp.]HZU58488.1 MFS transporter [Actinocrinis sp.]